ncbi:MAG: Rrf2 family transcriptional regulator [Phycisphaeraceae bacterium]|nr:Rrf2 family transcriptional regulator [Phycisphaeraceae bacterium]
MFSQTAEYALRAMTCLGSRTGAPSTTEAIAQQARIPAGYLAKVMRDLVVAHLVTSQRGPNGGFLLALPAERISVLDIVNAVDPVQRIRTCPAGNPQHLGLCSLHARLDEAMAIIEAALRATTLAQVVAEQRDERVCERLRKVPPPPTVPPASAFGASDAA